MNGILNVYKEKGYTSFDVIAVLRGILKERRIGHTGTLDPGAEGVLVACVGSAARLIEYFQEFPKEYIAVMLLGFESDTLDSTGTMTKTGDPDISEGELRKVIGKYTGEIGQIPPMYSAVKVNGQKLCDLARSGKTVERRMRKVTVYSIEILSLHLPYVRMKIRCSKGTYIRSLCRDIGRDLGCGAVLKSLLRTESGGFRVEDSLKLDEISALVERGEKEKAVLPVDRYFSSYPAYRVSAESDTLLLNGNRLPAPEETGDVTGGRIRVYTSEGRFAGIYSTEPGGTMKPWRMFLT